MVLTLTPIARSQWKKVGIVALWVVLTDGIGVLTWWLSKQPALLASGPLLNILGVNIKQIFTQAEVKSIAALPAADQPEINAVANDVAQQAGKIITPTAKQIPVTEPTNAPIDNMPGA